MTQVSEVRGNGALERADARTRLRPMALCSGKSGKALPFLSGQI